MSDQLWSDARIDETVRDMPLPLSCDLVVIGQIRIVRDDYEMQLDGYRERAERSPGIISALELENWKLNQRIAALEAEVKRLNDANPPADWAERIEYEELQRWEAEALAKDRSSANQNG